MACRSRSFPTSILAALVLALAAAPAGAADTPPAKEDPKDAQNPYMVASRGKAGAVPAGKVITNEDLEKLYGGRPLAAEAETEGTTSAEPATTDAAAAAAPAAEPADPLKQMFEQQTRAAEQRDKISAAEAKIAELRKRIADLERRKLAIVNPLLPRPSAPAKDGEAWNAASAPERVKMTDEALRQAQADLDKAQVELDQLRRATP